MVLLIFVFTKKKHVKEHTPGTTRSLSAKKKFYIHVWYLIFLPALCTYFYRDSKTLFSILFFFWSLSTIFIYLFIFCMVWKIFTFSYHNKNHFIYNILVSVLPIEIFLFLFSIWFCAAIKKKIKLNFIFIILAIVQKK